MPQLRIIASRHVTGHDRCIGTVAPCKLMGVCQVAVLSDVHGVLPVLEAVLAEPEVAAADLVVVTGDHASGPEPTAVLDRLLALGERALLVRGNADRELVALARGEQIDIPDEVTPWAAAELREDHVALLAVSRTPSRSRSTASVRCCSATARPETTRKSSWWTPGSSGEVFASCPLK